MGRIKQIADATETELDDYLAQLNWPTNPFTHPTTTDEYVLPSNEDIADVSAAIQSYTGPILIHSHYSGIGKTTLMRMLMDDLNDNYHTTHIPEHNVTPYELVAIIADDLGIGKSSSTKLTEQKIRDADINEPVLLGIDEFGLNDPDTLHSVQFLNDQGIRLVLTGMTNQWDAISQLGPEGRAFQRRVSYQLQLEPFTLEQSRELLARRIATATDSTVDAVGTGPFTEEAVRTMHERAEGVPGVMQAAAAELVGLGAYRYSQTDDVAIDEELADAVEYSNPAIE